MWVYTCRNAKLLKITCHGSLDAFLLPIDVPKNTFKKKTWTLSECQAVWISVGWSFIARCWPRKCFSTVGSFLVDFSILSIQKKKLQRWATEHTTFIETGYNYFDGHYNFYCLTLHSLLCFYILATTICGWVKFTLTEAGVSACYYPKKMAKYFNSMPWENVFWDSRPDKNLTNLQSIEADEILLCSIQKGDMILYKHWQQRSCSDRVDAVWLVSSYSYIMWHVFS